MRVNGGSQRYYIKKLGPNKVLLVATKRISNAYQELMTTLTGDGKNNAFKTLDDAMKEIDNREDNYEVIHDPENGVGC